MSPTFMSAAERSAEAATRLPSFGVNLHEIRRSVSEILSFFGRNNIFQEYTTHDISHIDKMLEDLDWLIPHVTQEQLSPADWLMIVLSIYFHDLGLVVTEDEFDARDKSGFREYCEAILFAGPDGPDYRAKMDNTPSDARERHLYQEYVREHHHRRINAWITGNENPSLGWAKEQIAIVSALLKPLGATFRRDLAMICESHNLDDIDDRNKYRTSYPYGDGAGEAVNLQFCAIVLRTVDLIQIRKDRAPSISYRLINPKDPISQVEWAKQNAVRAIKPKPATDDEGNVDPARISDTIEVFARFTNADGFFGLTSYLRYANSQLAKSHAIMRKMPQAVGRNIAFPWRYIDDANVEADGFIRQPFEFVIDQEKILNLLTGHTLYNDTAVVVRELTQNAIDAVRLQAMTEDRASSDRDEVKIRWNSSTRTLTIADNGTGMTQSVVEGHFLKVGSSLYQDSKFREGHPNFSSISRFGIGVLTAFMVADQVEITTVSEHEQQARQISLRSVHGKYLIKLLDKHSDAEALKIGPHGTSISLTFRPSSKLIDIGDALTKWIVIPRCNVEFRGDDAPPRTIGFPSPKAAVEFQVQDKFKEEMPTRSRIEVRERSIDGVTVAYALSYNAHYRDWSFVPCDSPDARGATEGKRFTSATCIEGIAVEFNSPGLHGATIFAIADATGRQSPRTNVARSAIEATDELDAFLRNVYRIYFQQVASEMIRLVSEEKYSLTWAVDQATYLLAPAMGRNNRTRDSAAHSAELAEVPLFLVESPTDREAMSLRELRTLGSVWTVDSQLMRSVESFIREANVDVTGRGVLGIHRDTAATLPPHHVLANPRAEAIQHMLHSEFEISAIHCTKEERRLQLQWSLGTGGWLSQQIARRGILSDRFRTMSSFISRVVRGRTTRVIEAYVPMRELELSGVDDYFAVVSGQSAILLPGNAVTDYISTLATADDLTSLKLYFALEFIAAASGSVQLTPRFVEFYFRDYEEANYAELVSMKGDLLDAISKSKKPLRVFDPYAWSRREAVN